MERNFYRRITGKTGFAFVCGERRWSAGVASFDTEVNERGERGDRSKIGN